MPTVQHCLYSSLPYFPTIYVTNLGYIRHYSFFIKSESKHFTYTTVYSSLPYFPTIYVTNLGYIRHYSFFIKSESKHFTNTIVYSSLPYFPAIYVTYLGYVLRGLLNGLEGVTGQVWQLGQGRIALPTLQVKIGYFDFIIW